MKAITFVVILLSLAVTLISVSLWMFVQDFREIRRRVLMLEADRKTEQTEPTHGKMLICPNCGLEVHSDFDYCPRCGAGTREREGE